jgi:nucleotide-binding universal stress UspA family protein
VQTGTPATAITKAAKDWPADLIVIGSHGRSGMRRALLGSVAEGVMRNAPCPVLVVRAQS